MNENYVVSLELAKRLKELGMPQRSEFVYFQGEEYQENVSAWKSYIEIYSRLDADKLPGKEICSAFLSDELLEWSPIGISIRKGWGLKNNYVVFDNEAIEICDSDTPSNALAKLLIYLLENKIIK
ncbi:MAG TPA: hypothetical protein DHV62_06790, partial [Elusimicrobia bacterium]|nr:hypothetical protein [Elusimicrobiota bacterium]